MFAGFALFSENRPDNLPSRSRFALFALQARASLFSTHLASR
jgi:hypothetical protein